MDWHGSFAHCLDDIREIKVIPGGAPAGCWDPSGIRGVVQQLVAACPVTWESDCFGAPKAPALSKQDLFARALGFGRMHAAPFRIPGTSRAEDVECALLTDDEVQRFVASLPAPRPAQAETQVKHARPAGREEGEPGEVVVQVSLSFTPADLAELGANAQELGDAIRNRLEGGVELEGGDTLYVNPGQMKLRIHDRTEEASPAREPGG
jgi:hypothetical protein